MNRELDALFDEEMNNEEKIDQKIFVPYTTKRKGSKKIKSLKDVISVNKESKSCYKVLS